MDDYDWSPLGGGKEDPYYYCFIAQNVEHCIECMDGSDAVYKNKSKCRIYHGYKYVVSTFVTHGKIVIIDL